MDIDYKNTAIARTTASKPLKDILDKLKSFNLDPKDYTWLDFGCGRGKDVEILQGLGATAFGYDPYWQPNTICFKGMDFVLCTYVLCILDDINDRAKCIYEAWERVNPDSGSLIVTTRTANEINTAAEEKGWLRFADGFITKSGTFQKGFTPEELHAFLCSVIPYDEAGMTINISTDKYTSIIIRKSKKERTTE